MDVLADLRIRFSSGNSVPVKSAKLTREEFAIICAGFCNWTGREPIKPPTTRG